MESLPKGRFSGATTLALVTSSIRLRVKCYQSTIPYLYLTGHLFGCTYIQYIHAAARDLLPAITHIHIQSS